MTTSFAVQGKMWSNFYYKIKITEYSISNSIIDEHVEAFISLHIQFTIRLVFIPVLGNLINAYSYIYFNSTNLITIYKIGLGDLIPCTSANYGLSNWIPAFMKYTI